MGYPARKLASTEERKTLYCIVYLDSEGHEKFAYLHAKDIGDARFQCMTSRKILDKGSIFLDVAQVVGWVEEDKKVIRVFGGM